MMNNDAGNVWVTPEQVEAHYQQMGLASATADLGMEPESVIAKGKTVFFINLSRNLDMNQRLNLDMGTNTADAYRQPDGSWEVHGLGSSNLVASKAVDAERKARKVAFLPRLVERRAVRVALLALTNTGEATLKDGTVIRRRTSANNQG